MLCLSAAFSYVLSDENSLQAAAGCEATPVTLVWSESSRAATALKASLVLDSVQGEKCLLCSCFGLQRLPSLHSIYHWVPEQDPQRH